MKKYFYNTSILIISVFLGLNTLARNFASFKNNLLTLDNGVIRRVIEINPEKKSFQTKSLKLTGSDEEFIVPGSEEFYFEINGIAFEGHSEWKFDSFENVKDENGGNGAKIILLNAEQGIELNIYYFLYPELPLVRKKMEFTNTGNAVLKLEALDIERMRFEGSGTGTNSWVLKNYARQKALHQYVGDCYDPIVIVHENNRSRGVFLGNEAPGVMKRTTAFLNHNLLTAGLTHPDQIFGFRKWLKQGETWESPWVFSGIYAHSDDPWLVLNTSVNDFVRRHLGTRIATMPQKPVFVYNTWEPFHHNIDEKLIYELADAAAECGAQEFIIDDGWQDSYGDWGINKEKFPKGLKPVFDYIKSKGMKPGVWISLAAAESTSRIFKEHPEWLVRKADGTPINLHADSDKMYDWESYSMCMTTGWKDYIKGVILKMVEEYGLEYIKADFAAVTGAYTTNKTRSGCHATNHSHADRNESLLEMYRATWQLFDELHEAAPGLFIDCTFETMGSLQLIDYDMCKHADGNWLSNFNEPAPVGALRVRQMAWWRSPTIPATSMVIGNQRLDDPNFLFSMKSLAGTLPIVLGDPRQLSKEQRAEIKTWADWLITMQGKYDFMAFRQDLPGFGEPMTGNWDGFQRINTETKAGGIIGVFKHLANEKERWVTVNYLDPQKKYKVLKGTTNEVVFTGTGEELRTSGFKVVFEDELDGELFEVTETSFQ